MHLLGITNQKMKLFYQEIMPELNLYFAFLNSGIIFSSEIKGLLSHVKGSNIIDRHALACTSLLGVNVLRQTIFKGIYKVLPGETIVYSIDEKD